MDPTTGQAHGRTTPFRWDASSAASVIVLGALAFLVWVSISFSASAHIGKR